MADLYTTKVGNVVYNFRDNEARETKEEIQEFINEHLYNIWGLEADFENSTFTRLKKAVGLNGGSDFDNCGPWMRRRCNLADDGTVNAYYGDSEYKDDGTNGQVMVEQPKFWYKVEPVTLDGAKIKKARYYVADGPAMGFKLHPAFYNTSGQEIDAFYEGAYEGYVISDKLGSISGYTPSGDYTRANFRTYAVNRGTGWCQETIWSLSADQILAIIEYGCFNMQDAIGNGCTNANLYLTTGTLNSYGNGTYGTTANETTAVQWRGKENPWGNVDNYIEGINMRPIGTMQTQQGRYFQSYIANGYDFDDNTTSYENYNAVNFYSNLPMNNGYIRYFGYDADYDWLFVVCRIGGNSSLPVGDSPAWMSSFFNVNYVQGVRVGDWKAGDLSAGPFRYICYTVNRGETNAGARLIYIGGIE